MNSEVVQHSDLVHTGSNGYFECFHDISVDAFNRTLRESDVERRSRLIRYAQGQSSWVGSYGGIRLEANGWVYMWLLFGVAGLVGLFAYSPRWLAYADLPLDSDPIAGTRRDSQVRVRAYFSPNSKTWVRLGENESPPTVAEIDLKYGSKFLERGLRVLTVSMVPESLVGY